MRPLAYKFLSPGAVGLYSGFRWPVPENGAPGQWVEATGKLVDCFNGVHACRVRDLPSWIDDELWTVELGGNLVERETMVIADRGRLVRRVEGWTAAAASDFAEACARRARDQAVRSLERARLTRESEELAGLDRLELVQERGAALATSCDGYPAVAAAFAADAVALASGRRPETWDAHPALAAHAVQTPGATAANLGFVVAYSAGREAADERGDDAYAAGFAAERKWQLAWLVDRLGLESA